MQTATEFQRVADGFAGRHGVGCEPQADGSVVVLVPWWKPDTEEFGADRVVCRSMAEVRAALGY